MHIYFIYFYSTELNISPAFLSLPFCILPSLLPLKTYYKSNKDIQTIYQQTIKYAAAKHLEVKQRLSGTEKLPIVIHLSDGNTYCLNLASPSET